MDRQEVGAELEQAKELGDKLQELIRNPPPEVKRATDTLGVPAALEMLARNTGPANKKGLALASFILGVYIGRQQCQLEGIYDERGA